MWIDRLGWNKRTILVVEHDHVIRQLLSQSLRPDYRTVETASGEEAVKLAAQHRREIDLLLTEVRLPRLFGWELMELLTLDYPNLKVVYVSKSMDPEIRSQARRRNILVLEHPFPGDFLRQVVREELGNPRSNRVEKPSSLFLRLRSYFRRHLWIHRVAS